MTVRRAAPARRNGGIAARAVVAIVCAATAACSAPTPEADLAWGRVLVARAERDMGRRHAAIRADLDEKITALTRGEKLDTLDAGVRERVQRMTDLAVGIDLRVALYELDSNLRRAVRERAPGIRAALMARAKRGESPAAFAPYLSETVLDDYEARDDEALRENQAEIAFWQAERARLAARIDDSAFEWRIAGRPGRLGRIGLADPRRYEGRRDAPPTGAAPTK